MSEGLSLAGALASELKGLRGSVEDAENAYQAANLLRGTRDDVVELALVRALGLFEEFVGELFYLALQSRLGSEVLPVMAATNVDEAILLVAGSDGGGEGRYVSWMPYKDKTIRRADRLLVNGQPFGRLANRSTDKQALGDLTVVRNRVAHDSSIARAKFEELAKSKSYPYTRAADFLTSQRGSDIEILLGLARLQAIGEGLAEETEAGSRGVLSAEDPYEATALAPPGAYSCIRNGHSQNTVVYSALGDCFACPRPVKCAVCGRSDKQKTLWARH